MRAGDTQKVQTLIFLAQKIEADLQKRGLKIKHHEDNLKFLKTQSNSLDESVRDFQVMMEKYQSSNKVEGSQSAIQEQEQQRRIRHILQKGKTAAGILYTLKSHNDEQASNLPLIKDVVGVVATLGKVKDDNISRLFSEYLGVETMLAIVCKTRQGVGALEEYDKKGMINKSAGLHGLGPSIGKPLDGRFLVICLEDLRTYSGDFVSEDPQKRLVMQKPRLPSGNCPPGFLGHAVNMIDVEEMYLSYITVQGNGLRESLFYSLFSHLQVYATRADMQNALPYICGGAISLDGGMVKSTGVFSLGDRREVQVRFAVSSGISNLPSHMAEIPERIRLSNWKKERIAEDIQREEALLNDEKGMFNTKKQELLKHLSETANYVPQGKTEGVHDAEKSK